jgi:hypothetical protein
MNIIIFTLKKKYVTLTYLVQTFSTRSSKFLPRSKGRDGKNGTATASEDRWQNCSSLKEDVIKYYNLSLNLLLRSCVQLWKKVYGILSMLLKLTSRWWSSDKNLKLKNLFPLWSQVRAMWLLKWWPLEAYMVINFRTRGISRNTYKLTRTPTLN